MNAAKLVEKAKSSAFYLWLLNWSFEQMIPFNRPHGFRIIEVGDYHVRTKIPYKTKNLNHLKGLHACALATLTEITCGFIFVMKLDPTKYRIILKQLQINYLYQGKTDAFGEFRVSPEWIQKNIFDPLQENESIEVVSEVNLVDANGKQLTNGKATWQVKDWTKVKTKA
jgi:acyl-coenzyme A thioesterase PaaI-like protein